MSNRRAPGDARSELQAAMADVREGRLADAEASLRDTLSRHPAQPDALHLLGICHHQRGESTEAIRLLGEAIERWPANDPQVFLVWNNLGNVLVETNEPGRAIAAYRSALTAEPTSVGTWNNLAGLLRRAGRLDEADTAARSAVAVAPDDPHGWFNLSRILVERGEVREALVAHARAVSIAPRNSIGREQVLLSLVVLGRRDEAATLWQEWLDDCPDDPVARHHAAACGIGAAPSRAAADYVTTVFDGFADSFDAKLAALHYEAPALVADALVARVGDRRLGAVADIGCGTGLVGPLLRGITDRLVGVDLSTGMLEHARRRGVYDDLRHDDLVHFLRDSEGQFDAIVAADVLCYFGDLTEMLTAAAAALRPSGVLVFTVESCPDEHEWQLQMTGRYAHSAEYVADQMAAFDSVTIECHQLRTEASQPVDGLVVVGSRESEIDH